MRCSFAALWTALVAIVVIGGACSTDVAVLAEATSQPRSAGVDSTADAGGGDSGGGGGAPAAGSAEACAWIEDLQANPPSPVDIDADPEAAAAAAEEFRRLAGTAPEEIRADIEAFADMFDKLVALGNGKDAADGFEAMDEMFRIFLDPEVIAAGERIQDFMVNECGVDPDEAGNLFDATPDVSGADPGDPPPDPGDGGAEEDIGLDDLEEVEKAHTGESWVEKISSTSVVNDRDIVLSAGGFSDPLTEQEALAACEAVRDALGDRQPELSVTVNNESTRVASGTAGQPCKAR